MNNILSLKIGVLSKANYSYFLAALKPFLVISIIVFAVIYVFQINFQIAEKYAIGQYENNVAQLLNETQSLEKTYTQQTSLTAINPLLKEMNFQSLGKTHYINITDQQVVVR